ncbi:amidase [Glutamicibacter halophytocola]|uniref:Amidase n=1 Tax=Glutamicibacter halophytocola TaxID=1933880 RepID=A0ABX5Y971_9MICC|nr:MULTISPECIES: amidase [Glutamicibacter]MBF6670900.1 amidase [Glutamicibacter sp. FBE19]NQD41352.1 amidase [Glutamicibacter halophytocola]QDY66210.1 amidase [Glutamicibacter halophytocola]
MTDRLAFLTATEQLRAFREGTLSPADVLGEQLANCEADNGRGDGGVNALTEIFWDESRAQAKAATDRYARARSTGELGSLPPLLGVSVAAKEKHALKGKSLSLGLLAHKRDVSETDHPIIDRLRIAGAIIHARSTSPEFSCATVTHSPMWGVTRNPWNLEMSPGGSSGGAGASLAAGFTTLATASDIAGSTRIPAGFTGTVGYKAPYGRIPGAGELASDRYRGDGPMGRSVADVLLMAAAISGTHPADANSWGSAGELIKVGNLRNSQLRIGVSRNLGDYPVTESVLSSFDRLIESLKKSGFNVVEVQLPWTTDQIRETIFAHFGHILAPAMVEAIGDSNEPRAAYTDQFIRDALTQAQSVSMLDSLRKDATLNAQLSDAMSVVDVLLCPTNAVDYLSATGNYLNGIEVSGRKLSHYWEGHMTSPFNVSNHRPVLSIPCGIGRDNVPVGVQIVGQPWDEKTVFEAALLLESLIDFRMNIGFPEPVG